MRISRTYLQWTNKRGSGIKFLLLQLGDYGYIPLGVVELSDVTIFSHSRQYLRQKFSRSLNEVSEETGTVDGAATWVPCPWAPPHLLLLWVQTCPHVHASAGTSKTSRELMAKKIKNSRSVLSIYASIFVTNFQKSRASRSPRLYKNTATVGTVRQSTGPFENCYEGYTRIWIGSRCGSWGRLQEKCPTNCQWCAQHVFPSHEDQALARWVLQKLWIKVCSLGMEE